jgi:hypothetical protein
MDYVFGKCQASNARRIKGSPKVVYLVILDQAARSTVIIQAVRATLTVA